MTDRYVDTSLATGLNDGTSIANAWQSLVEVLTNTMASGSMVAGDTINIRTHDGVINCVESFSADKTLAFPSSEASPTTLVFDDGTIWANAGQFILTATTSAVQFNGNAASVYSIWLCDGLNHRFILESLDNDFDSYHSAGNFLVGSYYDGFKVRGLNTGYNIDMYAGARNIIMKDFEAETSANGSAYPMLQINSYTALTLIDPVFNLTSDINHHLTGTLLGSATYGGSITVLGGTVIGAWDGLQLYSNSSGYGTGTNVKIEGMNIGDVVLDLSQSVTSAGVVDDAFEVSVVGCTGDFDVSYRRGHNVIEYRKDNLAPYLNSTLPDSASTGWSYKVTALEGSKGSIGRLVPIEKFYTQPSSVRTLTLEFMIDTAFVGITDDLLYATFIYTDDTTGKKVTVTTKGSGGNVSTSLASWTNNTYGAKAFTNYKIEITTINAIRQDSVVRVLINSGLKRINSTDFFFYDPDVGVA